MILKRLICLLLRHRWTREGSYTGETEWLTIIFCPRCKTRKVISTARKAGRAYDS